MAAWVLNKRLGRCPSMPIIDVPSDDLMSKEERSESKHITTRQQGECHQIQTDDRESKVCVNDGIGSDLIVIILICFM